MKVDSCSFGRIVIDGKSYSKDVIIFPHRVFSPWWRSEGHLLQMDDLAEVLKEKPAILVVGSGYSGVMRVPRKLVEELHSLGVEVRTEKTPDAVNVFNNISGKKVIAALHLTC